MAFNQSQEEAIHHEHGPMMVLAGPGSGKTTVITHRTKYLIEECTFTPLIFWLSLLPELQPGKCRNDFAF